MVNWDRSILGKEFARTEVDVTRDMLLDFADQMGTTNPIYLDPEAAHARGYRDIIAMPGFILVTNTGRLCPPEMDYHGIGLNAGYECTYHEVIYPGDRLTFSTCLVDLYEKTGRSGLIRFIVRETIITNQRGATVAVMRNPFVLD